MQDVEEMTMAPETINKRHGDDHVLLTAEALEVGAVSALVGAEDAGGISIFVGTTRDNFEGKRVSKLE